MKTVMLLRLLKNVECLSVSSIVSYLLCVVLLYDCLVIPRFLVLSLYELVYLLRDCLVIPRFL